MLRRAAILTIVTLGLMGCGGASSARPAQALDAEAKSDARNAVTQVESCLVDVDPTYGGRGTAADCATTARLGDVGRARVRIRDGDHYTVEARSASGTAFGIVKDGPGGYERTCTAGGQGGCQAGGTW